MKRIGILTSSRADYGIYRPLLKAMQADGNMQAELLVFGMHLSAKHGNTGEQVEKEALAPVQKIMALPHGDTPREIALAMADTINHFASFWEKNGTRYDLIIALGDRFEMFAAVTAALPFGLRIAHLHGGETTTGAIDEAFRHSITHMAAWHFTSTEAYRERVIALRNSSEHVYNVGALSLDNLDDMLLPDAAAFEKKWHIPMHEPTVLVTFHPETVNWEHNRDYVIELCKAMDQLPERKVITMPNADTMGNTVREVLREFAEGRIDTHLVESFGTEGYFACMNLCSFLLGNSSSGIVEAASFGKYVINVGQRQGGRLSGPNVLHCPADAGRILQCAAEIRAAHPAGKKNIYGNGKTAGQIMTILNKLLHA